jgi:hypothetical protein
MWNLKSGRLLIVTLSLISLLAASSVVFAQSGGGYDLSWSTVDGGGGTFSSGGSYSLGGTVGQPDAGAMMSGGGYTLAGGYWAGASTQYRNYLPVVLRN